MSNKPLDDAATRRKLRYYSGLKIATAIGFTATALIVSHYVARRIMDDILGDT